MDKTSSQRSVNLNRLAGFAIGQLGLRPDDLKLDVQMLRGGLRAKAVARVTGRAPGRLKDYSRFIVKCVTGSQQREAAVYISLNDHNGAWLAPRLLGLDRAGDNRSYLYLEDVAARRRWPWRDLELAGQVLEALAWVHKNLPKCPPFIMPGYEAHLIASASDTLELFERAVREPRLAPLAKARRHLRGVVERLPEIRRTLLSWQTVVVHGDVHPGNLLVRLRRGRAQPLLIDWENVRVGSPFEDVASWLQSLAYWEPRVRRRHDTLLKRYLSASGFAPRLTGEIRRHYWLAAACNALAGALRYHLWVAHADDDPKRRMAAMSAARDWLRIIRRAHES